MERPFGAVSFLGRRGNNSRRRHWTVGTASFLATDIVVHSDGTEHVRFDRTYFFANNGLDTPEYIIGEEIYIANIPGNANQKALRYMFKPIKDTRSPKCCVSTFGSLDVHYSSSLGAIGQAAASKIWYRALTTKMLSNTNCAGARAATITAANELVTLGEITSAQASVVAATWSAVGVN